jgi:hypothetical protein
MGGIYSRLSSSSIPEVTTPPQWTPSKPTSTSTSQPAQSYRPEPLRTQTSTSIMSYFLPLPRPETSHVHFLHPPLEVAEISQILASDLGIPLELIPRILDYAEVRSGCIRVLEKVLVVNAPNGMGMSAVKGPRERGWRCGQEEGIGWVPEVGDDEGDAGGLRAGEEPERMTNLERGGSQGPKDSEGNYWYMCSEPIGCVERSAIIDQPAMGDDDDGVSPRGDVPDFNVCSWLREIHVETVSRDQGWSSGGAQHYGKVHYLYSGFCHLPNLGTYENSYSWFELSLLRDGEEVLDSRYSIQNNVHGEPLIRAAG